MRVTDKYIFFYGSYLSQWYQSDFIVDGITFNTAEQYMMYCKAMLFSDNNTASLILNTTDPKEQKRLGRLVSNFDKQIWEMNCLSIVYKGNFNKFSQNKIIKDYLLDTGNRILVEGSPTDMVWGVGLIWNDELINDPINWKGTNLLGQVLMMVRNELR